MKKITLLIAAMLIIVAVIFFDECTKDAFVVQEIAPTGLEINENTANKSLHARQTTLAELNGKWQLDATYQVDAQNVARWIPANETETLEFSAYQTVKINNNQTGGEKQGNWGLDNIRLELSYDDGKQASKNFILQGNYLILTPAYKNCPNGCDKRYRKVAEKNF